MLRPMIEGESAMGHAFYAVGCVQAIVLRTPTNLGVRPQLELLGALGVDPVDSLVEAAKDKEVQDGNAEWQRRTVAWSECGCDLADEGLGALFDQELGE